jgi:hypothetical protein
VFLDITLSGTYEVIKANINSETLDDLLSSDTLKLVAPNRGLGIVNQDHDKNLKQLVSLDFKMGEKLSDKKFLKQTFKSSYSSVLINTIRDLIIIPNFNYSQVLENSYNDYFNLGLLSNVFEYVKSYFNLTDFGVTPERYGIRITPSKSLSKVEEERILTFASYGVHLIGETNYRLMLLEHYGEMICEEEYKSFYEYKLKSLFKTYTHKTLSQNFIELCEIHNFPNIKEAIGTNLFKIDEIFALRNGNGKILREWLNSVTQKCDKERIEFSKECASILANNKGLSLPVRTVAFGFLQTLSYIKPAAATIASMGYEYVLPKLVNKWEPRFFFDNARRKYINKNEMVTNNR